MQSHVHLCFFHSQLWNIEMCYVSGGGIPKMLPAGRKAFPCYPESLFYSTHIPLVMLLHAEAMMDQLCMHFMRHTLTFFFFPAKNFHTFKFLLCFPLWTAPHKSNAGEGFRTNSAPGESVILLNLLFTSTKEAQKKLKSSSPGQLFMPFKAIRKQKSGIVRTIWLASLALLPITCWKWASPEGDKAHWAAEVECSNYISNSPPKCCSLVCSRPVLQTLHMSLSTLNWLSPSSCAWCEAQSFRNKL